MDRILCTADVHIGRYSSLDGIDLSHTDGVDLTALGAFERIVHAAIEGNARALVIAGDLYDSLAAQYQGRPRVRAALERLQKVDIPVLAVAGNHDHNALPAFAQQHPNLIHLFPADRWGEKRINGLRFVGRSFSAAYERQSLLSTSRIPPADVTTVGIIHADINAQSPYGPTPESAFQGTGVSAWVAGHVHVPRSYLQDTVIYPGSPQALDWGETGEHGVRWLEIDTNRCRFSPCTPISTVRYEFAEVELHPGDDFESKLLQTALDHRRQYPELGTIQFRIRARICPDVAQQLAECDQTITLGSSDSYSIISKTDVPNVDLKQEATQSDARGQAARLLLGLKGEGDAAWQNSAAALVEQVGAAISRERSALVTIPCENVEHLRFGDPLEARDAVRRALERVLAAKGGRS